MKEATVHPFIEACIEFLGSKWDRQTAQLKRKGYLKKPAVEKPTRNKEGDRPALVMPSGHYDPLPQLVGFVTEEGTPFQITRERAIEEGRITEDEVPKLVMPVRDYIEIKSMKGVIFPKGS